jgi:flavodoxin
MQTVVIYDSRFGNTEKIAEAIGRGAGTRSDVRVMSTAEADGVARTLPGRPDLLLLGGPTQKRGPSPALRGFLADLPGSLRAVPAVCFDTRYRGPLLLMGSAAAGAAKVLAATGAPVIAPPESFFIARKGPMELQQLEPGELERAEGWGRAVLAGATGA